MYDSPAPCHRSESRSGRCCGRDWRVRCPPHRPQETAPGLSRSQVRPALHLLPPHQCKTAATCVLLCGRNVDLRRSGTENGSRVPAIWTMAERIPITPCNLTHTRRRCLSIPAPCLWCVVARLPAGTPRLQEVVTSTAPRKGLIRGRRRAGPFRPRAGRAFAAHTNRD